MSQFNEYLVFFRKLRNILAHQNNLDAAQIINLAEGFGIEISEEDANLVLTDWGVTSFIYESITYGQDEFFKFIRELIVSINPENVLVIPHPSSIQLLTVLNELQIDSSLVNSTLLNKEGFKLLSRISGGELQYSIVEKDDLKLHSYDLVLDMRPFGMKGGIEIEELLQIAPVKKSGKIIHSATPSFFLTNKNSGKNIASRTGYNLSAIFEFPPGFFDRTNIVSSLVIMDKSPQKKVFAARAFTEQEGAKRVISNWVSGITSQNPEFGICVELQDFNGLRSIIARGELEALALKRGYNLLDFNEVILSYKVTRSQNFERCKHLPNSVYIPKMYAKSAITQDKLSERLKSYIQLELNPDVADAKFFCLMMNDVFGKQMFECVATGNTMRAISQSGLKQLPIYLPDIEKQQEIIEAYDTIRDVESELEVIKSKCWLSESTAGEVGQMISKFAPINTVDYLLSELPFPLASILQLYKSFTADSHKDRYETLLHFFEATSLFTAVIHLSAWKDHDEFDTHWRSVNSHMSSKNEEWITKPTFGSWNTINSKFSKIYRQQWNEPKIRDSLREIYSNVDEEFLNSLSSKKYSKILDGANTIRNQHKGHSGVIGNDEAETHHRSLLDLLDDFRSLFSNSLTRVSLFVPGKGEMTTDGYSCDLSVLTGAMTPFNSSSAIFNSPPHKDKLYLYSSPKKTFVELLRFIKLGPTPSDVLNSCYFFGGIKKDGQKFLNYHSKSITDTYYNDPLVQIAVDLLS